MHVAQRGYAVAMVSVAELGRYFTRAAHYSRSKPSRRRRVCVDIAAVADVKDLHLGIVADDPVYDAVFADANAAEPSPMAM